MAWMVLGASAMTATRPIRRPRPRRPVRTLATLAAVATMTALVPVIGPAPVQAQDSVGTSSLGETSPAATTAAAAPLRFKPPLRGLVVTEPRKLRTVPYASSASMKLQWNAIETRPGVFDFSAVDRALDAHPQVRFRLRFKAGIHAPQWVKEDAGGCVLITPDSANGGSGCAARFWRRSYRRDYLALMKAVAARYERDWQVVEIPNSACTTIYAEPFILGADDASLDRLWRAGYTKRKHGRCVRRTTGQMIRLFPRTRVSLAGHSRWQYIVARPGDERDGVREASWEAERRLLNKLLAAHGRHLVLEDHGLGPDDRECRTPGQPRRTAGSWYCYLAGLHRSAVAYGWQFTLNGGPMTEAANAGVAMGACYLEYAAFDALTPTKRRNVHRALRINCRE
ncbi:hypothetical protein [Nocardioides bizhenqiangii]|uniref:Glycoside hydrolase family 42 N-terminal domain-containing protein n=1 Tax=Nocardioides bizhenqiangii TaxID=3095076 RepID=A0ABZ0ZPG6_9ACTN|nr:hypothetical protein [Nocardioides sp. HM61]WQQ26103.1 hypothetical protein SHK19_19335 [Nocardioides sp. HM61]